MNVLVYAIILNYNSAIDCEECVRWLVKQEYQFLKIIIVDNHSLADGEQKRLKNITAEYDIELVLNSTNNGYSAGNNIGLQFAVREGAEWCLIVNPDVVIANSHYVSQMLNVITRYPNTVVAASKMLLPDGKRQNPYIEPSYSEELLWPFEIFKQKLGKTQDYLLPDITGYCPKVSGCCFFIKSSFLKEIGYLDDNVFLYCEEPILASQVKTLGYKELYVSEVYAYHNHVPSQKGKTSDRMMKLLDSRIYYLKKYSGYTGLLLKLVLFSKRLQKFFWRIKG